MRRLSLVLVILLAAPIGGGAFAQAKIEPRAEKAAPETKTKRPPATLDDLFARLAAAKDESEANGVANLIERRWARSGSDTADLLMSRAGDAFKGKDFPLAIELLDRVLTL
ncbi:MAG: hypothetical protein ACJ8BE_02825, partial [Microvirga sp.]